MSLGTYKTKVVLNLQGTKLTYFSPKDSETVVLLMAQDHPIFLQTHDGHCVIVNPNQRPAMEVYAI